MKERPILFSGSMVRALLSNSKTQTRRIYKSRKHPDAGCDIAACELVREPQHVINQICPYGQPGDHIWVKETWSVPSLFDKQKPSDMDPHYLGVIRYYADGYRSGKLRPSIFMPRWASRIVLEIVSVHVERLGEISAADCWAEGIPHSQDVNPVHEYEELWKSINKSYCPEIWVWVVEFKKI